MYALPVPIVNGVVPLSARADVDIELCQVFQDVGALPEMVTPVGDPEGGFVVTPARYPVPPIPDSSVVMAEPLEVPSLIGLTGEDPATPRSSTGSVVRPLVSPTSPVMSTPEGSPSSKAAAMDQYLPWNGLSSGREDRLLPPASLTPRPTSSSPHARESDAAGGRSSLPELCREGPFDILQDSGALPRILDGMQGCQYRTTSYDEDQGGPDFTPAYGVQLHDPRLLEYVCAPELVRLLSRSPEYWLHHLGREKTFSAALQLQHDAGLILSNVQVLQQLVTVLNRTLSEVMRVAFGRRLFPPDVMQQVGRLTGFVGRPTRWRRWACGGHLQLRRSGDLCRWRRAMLACRAVTASRTCHSELGGEVELYSRVLTVSLDISYCYIPCSLSVCWVSLPFLTVLVGR